jgi:hypothetical protein
MSSWYDELDADVEVAARETAGNWRKFDSFAWGGRPECADECALIYLSHRDSHVLDKSNEAVILDALSEFTGRIDDPDDVGGSDVETQSHNHWAVGHIDGVVIRCIRDGKATAAFKALHELAMCLTEHPVLDEDDFSDRECEAKSEDWDDYGASDFRSTLKKLAPHHADLFDHVESDHLYTIWNTIAEKTGNYAEHDGRSTHFPFDRVFCGSHFGKAPMTWKDVRRVFLDVGAH